MKKYFDIAILPHISAHECQLKIHLQKNLTRHAVKKICESTNVQEDFKDVAIIFQVINVELFDESANKKNIKGRVHLSDGNSKLLVMMSEKAFNEIISSG